MKCIYFALTLLLVNPMVVLAEDSGYVEIIEIKTWQSKNDVYIAKNHNCSGKDKRRYHLKKEREQSLALLLTGFAAKMKANLNYKCESDGYPSISGV